MTKLKKNFISKSNKRFEFSQRLVTVSWVVTIVWITLSFILSFLDKDANSEVTVALITESFGVTLAYFIYQASLKISRNVCGIDCDGIPYKVKQKIEEIVNFADSNSSEKGDVSDE